jgi:hypothetical protein
MLTKAEAIIRPSLNPEGYSKSTFSFSCTDAELCSFVLPSPGISKGSGSGFASSPSRDDLMTPSVFAGTIPPLLAREMIEKTVETSSISE